MVDEERQRLQFHRGGLQPGKFQIGDLASPDFLGWMCLLGENTCCELLGRHFEAEKADDGAINGLLRAVLRSGPEALAMLKAMFVASAVLPMDGRPASTIRSEL